MKTTDPVPKMPEAHEINPGSPDSSGTDLSLTRPTFVAWSQHRVLYADTDAMGIVYNGAYFRFFERARDEYLRQRGMPYSAIEARGLSTPLTEAYAHYYSSFRYDEIITMECWISTIKRASFRFEYRLFLPETPQETKVGGYTTLAVLDKASQKICKIPDWMMALLI